MNPRRAAGRLSLASAALLAWLLPPVPAIAEEEEGMRPGAGTPFSIRNAWPQSRDELLLRGTVGYERDRDRTRRLTLDPTAQLGLTDDLELRLGGRSTLGEGEDRGTLSAGLRWRFMEQEEGGWRPTLSLLGEVGVPWGAGDRGTVTELSLLASRTTGRGPGSWGVHLNAGILLRPDPGAGEREAGYRFGAALAHVIAEDTMLVGAFLQETQDRGERDLQVLEAGFEHRLGGGWAVAALAGTGLNRDSPALLLRAAVQYTFSVGR